MSSLPLGLNRIKIERSLTTSALAVFVPFVTQELFMGGESMYYGLNALSNNMILLDRKQSRCPNGLVFGTPGSGKSMSCKREITFIILTTKDNVIICDPEDEYSPLVKRLGGQVIRLSPSSTDYVNPLDINLNYSDEENPLALKSDFVLSFCELIMGSKTGLEAIEKTVIDRAVQKIYQPYFADPRPENMPILGDLMEALLAQGIPEADRVAQALDLYVNGSLNFFNHRTTVDIRNRLVCFDIKGLGKNLKKPGMLIVQDAVWNTVTINRAIGRSTWYFVDEFHLLLKEEQTAAYSAEIWKRFRKWGGVPTGATQNPKDLLSSPEIENILENSDFIYMLNQAAGDRKILAERLNISPEQLAYVTNSDPGHGLLFFNNVILPFADDFPKDTELYKLLTTKPSEGGARGGNGGVNMKNKLYVINGKTYLSHINDEVHLYGLLHQLAFLAGRIKDEEDVFHVLDTAKRYGEIAEEKFQSWGIPGRYLVFGDPKDLKGLMDKELDEVEVAPEEEPKPKKYKDEYIIPGYGFRMLVGDIYNLIVLYHSLARRLSEAETEKDFLRLKKKAGRL